MKKLAKSDDKIKWLLLMEAALLLALMFGLYQAALSGGLVWDDFGLISRHQIDNTSAWFENSFRKPYLSDGYYYRPIPLVTMILDGAGGMEHFPYRAHLSNLIFFYINILLILVLAYKLSDSVWKGFLAALFYTLHPAMIEPVVWTAGRCDLLMTLFILSALAADVFVYNRFFRIAGVTACFLLAALSKEMAVIFPALYLGWRLYIEEVRFQPASVGVWLLKKDNAIMLACILATGVFYLFLRTYLQGGLFVSTSFLDKESAVGGEISHLFLVCKTYFYYVMLSVFPHYELNVLYDTEFPVSYDDKGVIPGALMLLASAWLLGSKILHDRTKYALLIVLLLFFPISNLKVIVTWNNIIYLRYLTLPVAIIAILILPLLCSGYEQLTPLIRRMLMVVVFMWVGSASLNIITTVPLWTNDMLLWKWVVESKEKAPHYAWDNYARAAMISQDYQLCIEAVDQSIRVNPNSIKSQANGATCSYLGGSYPAVRKYSSKIISGAVESDPVTRSKMITLAVMADIKRGVKDWKGMKNQLKDALMYDAGNKGAYYLLNALRIKTKDQPSFSGISAPEKKEALSFIANIGILDPEEMMILESSL